MAGKRENIIVLERSANVCPLNTVVKYDRRVLYFPKQAETQIRPTDNVACSKQIIFQNGVSNTNNGIIFFLFGL
jgi:hypothetical protein